MTSRSAVLVTTCLLLSLGGCDCEGDPVRTCSTMADCRSGEICVDDRCTMGVDAPPMDTPIDTSGADVPVIDRPNSS